MSVPYRLVSRIYMCTESRNSKQSLWKTPSRKKDKMQPFHSSSVEDHGSCISKKLYQKSLDDNYMSYIVCMSANRLVFDYMPLLRGLQRRLP